MNESNERLTYNPGEFTRYGEPIIDELVAHNASVHLECLTDSCYMLIVENERHHWHLTIHSKGGKAAVVARVFEEYKCLKKSGSENEMGDITHHTDLGSLGACIENLKN